MMEWPRFRNILGARFGADVMGFRCTRLMLCVCVVVGFAISVSAQQKPNIAGDYRGSLGPLHLKLHLQQAADGSLSGTLDSLDQGAMGLQCADFHFDGNALSFTVPIVHGSWKGVVKGDGPSLSGTWDQGSPMPLEFTRDTFVAAAKPSPVDGIWLGNLPEGKDTLRIQITVKSDREGKEFCSLDSLDQDAMGIGCANALLKGSDFAFEVPSVNGRWAGKLSADGNSLDGTWTQGEPRTLNFVRQAVALALKPIPPSTYDPAIAPVSGADLQKVLTKDLEEAMKSGELAPATEAGVSIGVIDSSGRAVFTFGTAKTDSIFEIGSISKTFTGLILAQMIAQGKVKLDEPVRELLPPGTVAKPSGAEITLLDLVTQHSGLPRMPDNFKPKDNENPYADYNAADLYAFVAKHGVAKPADAAYLYSNLGFGLLGQALANRAGVPYPTLLKQEVTDPLGLNDTVINLSPDQQRRFIPGHDAKHRPAHAWDLVAFAGAGAIRSTAGDMLTYVEANLRPESVKAMGADGKTLAAALVASHELRADAFGGQRIAFAWHYEPDTGNYWHNGATGGYSSYAFLNPKAGYAAVVLLNTSIGSSGSFADRLGKHIAERLAGKPAISLAP
jgi:serine-type D-Ala-D-Ala carboxypeptidase/endopeptidase